jgi:CDP-diacylglycerol--glycerol-3-phosphate 3-phosphatidyltransferase
MWKLVPNILTFARLGLTIIFLLMILYSSRLAHPSLLLDLALALFIIAAVTDVVDGFIARRYDAASKLGRMIDPLVDKVLVCGAFLCFAVIGWPTFSNWGPVTGIVIRWLVVVVLVVREVYVTVLRHIAEARGINFAAVTLGKVKMFIQSIAIGTVLIKTAHVPTATWGQWFTLILFAIMIVVTVASGLQATRRPRSVTQLIEG